MPDVWSEWWEAGPHPRDAFRNFVKIYLLELLCTRTPPLTYINFTNSHTAKYAAEPYANFPFRNWDSIAFKLSLVMTGWHAAGIPQLPSASFDDRKTGALALVHWKELTTRIPKSFRGNPWAKDYPGRLPLHIMELSEFEKCCPSMLDLFILFIRSLIISS